MVVLLEPVGKGTFPAERHDHVDERSVENGFLTEFEKRENVRMIEGGDGPGLALKEASNLFIGGGGSYAHSLDGNLAINEDILGKVDLAHAATTQQTQKAI